jgi:pilus assembly protein Flp/PilA
MPQRRQFITFHGFYCHVTFLGFQTYFFRESIFLMLFAPKEMGQGLVEYAIIPAFIAIVVVGVVRLPGPRIGNTFGDTASPCRNLIWWKHENLVIWLGFSF